MGTLPAPGPPPAVHRQGRDRTDATLPGVAGPRTNRRARRIAGAAWRWTTFTLLAVVLAIAVLVVVVPKVTGAVPLTVLSGSMEPNMPIGSLVVVRPTMDLSVDSRTLSPEQIDKVNKVETIDVGDVIVYAPRRASGVMVIHRVLSVSQDSRGQREFITKGDANPAQDQPVAGYQVRAVSWYHVPVLGYVNTWIGSGNRKLVAIPFAVVGYAWSVVLVTRSLRRGADLDPAGSQRGPTHAVPRV